MNDQQMVLAPPGRWDEHAGRLLRDVIDDLWRAAALERAEQDPKLRQWRASHRRLGAQRTGMVEGLRRHVAAPPSDGLLRLLLGAAWWDSFDGLLAVSAVPSEVDPLHRYAANIPAPARTRMVSEIEQLRPMIFADAVAPLLRAISAGELMVVARSGVECIEMPRDMFAGQSCIVRRDGTLIVRAADGHRAYDRARIERPRSTPDKVAEWMNSYATGAIARTGGKAKRDDAMEQCRHATGCSYREALAAWTGLPAHLRRAARERGQVTKRK